MSVALVLGQFLPKVVTAISIPLFMSKTDEFVTVGGLASKSVGVED